MKRFCPNCECVACLRRSAPKVRSARAKKMVRLGGRPHDKIDPREKAMTFLLWLGVLFESQRQFARVVAGRNSPAVAQAMSRVRQVARRIAEADRRERRFPTLAATQRLLAAGALPPSADRHRDWCLADAECIPEDWP